MVSLNRKDIVCHVIYVRLRTRSILCFIALRELFSKMAFISDEFFWLNINSLLQQYFGYFISACGLVNEI